MSNREIKFRARDLVLDKYVDWKSLLEGDNFRSVLFDKNFTIEQYTGLKDKNGKEIYEGDVLSCYNHDADNHYEGKVVWSSVDNGYKLEDTDGDEYDLYKYHIQSVIGNIHENPELLKG